MEELDIRASDVTRDLQDSQFRLDAHDAMIRGLEKIVLAGKWLMPYFYLLFSEKINFDYSKI